MRSSVNSSLECAAPQRLWRNCSAGNCRSSRIRKLFTTESQSHREKQNPRKSKEGFLCVSVVNDLQENSWQPSDSSNTKTPARKYVPFTTTSWPRAKPTGSTISGRRLHTIQPH